MDTKQPPVHNNHPTAFFVVPVHMSLIQFVTQGAKGLKMHREFSNLILDGKKSSEIRGQRLVAWVHRPVILVACRDHEKNKDAIGACWLTKSESMTWALFKNDMPSNHCPRELGEHYHNKGIHKWTIGNYRRFKSPLQVKTTRFSKGWTTIIETFSSRC